MSDLDTEQTSQLGEISRNRIPLTSARFDDDDMKKKDLVWFNNLSSSERLEIARQAAAKLHGTLRERASQDASALEAYGGPVTCVTTDRFGVVNNAGFLYKQKGQEPFVFNGVGFERRIVGSGVEVAITTKNGAGIDVGNFTMDVGFGDDDLRPVLRFPLGENPKENPTLLPNTAYILPWSEAGRAKTAIAHLVAEAIR